MEEPNDFNYFSEIEEYFWRKRGAHVLVSPLDWAIVETWQKAGIPVQAVLKGIDRAFESYRNSRRGQSGRPLKSLVYCVDAVLDAAVESEEASAGAGLDAARQGASRHFSAAEIGSYFDRNIERLRRATESVRTADPGLAAGFDRTAERLAERRGLLDGEAAGDLEDLERWLTALEEKLSAALTVAVPENMMVEIRSELDRALAPYRSKMTAEQLALLEQQYVRKRLWERYGLPRLSLFYLT